MFLPGDGEPMAPQHSPQCCKLVFCDGAVDGGSNGFPSQVVRVKDVDMPHGSLNLHGGGDADHRAVFVINPNHPKFAVIFMEAQGFKTVLANGA
jgi:hypothetical protein